MSTYWTHHSTTNTMSGLLIRNVRLCPASPNDTVSDSRELYDVTCTDGAVASICAAGEAGSYGFETVDAEGRGLLIPGLCHAHIHLDKCFLLQRTPLITGTFAEALILTATAKAAFERSPDDILARGRRLIEQSIANGVTAMRAHVEADITVGLMCVSAGVKLREEFMGRCVVQVAAFAQDPLFDASGTPTTNHYMIGEAAHFRGVEAVGSAPYVEPTPETARANILHLFDLAYLRHLHLDFHLDYNLDASAEPLIWFVLDTLAERIASGRWDVNTQHLCIGHATRLTLFSDAEWARFAQTVERGNLPVTLVGLPQSDVYMMGRDVPSPPRGTLNVCKLATAHGVRAAMAVNNIGNAFTPQGPPDPLVLCTLGVALFQAGTKADCYRLLESVTVHASRAIFGSHGSTGQGASSSHGPRASTSLRPRVGDRADFVLLRDAEDVQAAVCNPCYDRVTMQGGRVVCRRESKVEFV
ncbi:Metallo-dependent hydrolase [Trametopsis cervina]|nr:Metallo-dependent hydrolase [Trametopsis cervina]